MNIPDKAVEAAARNHYAHVWKNVNGDPEVALGNWDAGQVDPDTMTYHRDHVRPQVEAAAPCIQAQALRDAADLFAEEEGVEVLAFAGDFTDIQVVKTVEIWLRERAAVAEEKAQRAMGTRADELEAGSD